MDSYTRVVLTVIALALVVIAARGVSPISPAHAADELECSFDGPLEISSFRDDLDVNIKGFSDDLKVKTDSQFSAPGSSSSSPMYIKNVD